MNPERPQKRARYVSKACNQCKRRKTKCDGQDPCRVCIRKRCFCQYREESPPPINEAPGNSETMIVPQSLEPYSHTQMAAFHDRLRVLESLTRSIHAAVTSDRSSLQVVDNEQNEQDSDSSPRDHPLDLQSFPYAGPSSSQYILELVRDSLSKTTSLNGMSSTGFVQGRDSIRPRRRASSSATTSIYVRPKSLDTLDSLGPTRIVEACQTYAALVGSMYPLVDSSFLQARATVLDRCSQHEKRLLKAVVAIGEALKIGDQSEVTECLLSELARDTSGTLYSRRQSVQDIQLWGLMALYDVHIGDEALASRFIGLAARSCLEAGWHQSETLKRLFPVATELSAVSDIFWSIYILDRRASLGLGIPYIISDVDVDPKLPLPPSPYLKCMLEFARLSGKVQQSINSHIRGAHISTQEDMDFLNFQIERWHENVPPPLNFCATEDGMEEAPKDETTNFLRLVLFARKNQGRLLIYRPSLISAKSAAENPRHIRTAVQIAIETILSLADNAVIYTRQPVVFNHFILSSLAILVLAANHAPEAFSTESVREGFQRGTQLLKDGCKVSQVTSRLWARVEDVEKLGASSKLSDPSLEEVDPSSAEQGMNGSTIAGEGTGLSTEPVDFTTMPTLDFDFVAEGSHIFSDFLNFTNLGNTFLQETTESSGGP